MLRIFYTIALAIALSASNATAASLDLTTSVRRTIAKLQVVGFSVFQLSDGTDVAYVKLRSVDGGKEHGTYTVQLADLAGTCSVLRRNADGDDVEVVQGQLGAGVLSGFLDVIGGLGNNANKNRRDRAILTYLRDSGVIAANLAGTVNQ